MVDVPLRDYFEARLDALDQKLNLLFQHIEKNTKLARDQVDARLAVMNEIRGAMNDMTERMLTKAEFELTIRALSSDIRDLREWRATMEGKASQSSVNIALLLAGVGLIIGMLSLAAKFLGM